MFVLNDDMSIYATRGDTVFFTVCATDGSGARYKFKPDDVVRFKAFEKKACENVVAQKDFVITEETEEVNILLTEDDTRFGKIISKPRDYWYEIELNPFTNPQTIIGYDDDGPKVFRLYPESKNIVKDLNEEEFYADAELSMTSTNPVQNQAVTRAVANLTKHIDDGLKGVKDSVLSEEEALRIRGELRRLDAEVTQQKSDFNEHTHTAIDVGAMAQKTGYITGTIKEFVKSLKGNASGMVAYSDVSDASSEIPNGFLLYNRTDGFSSFVYFMAFYTGRFKFGHYDTTTDEINWGYGSDSFLPHSGGTLSGELSFNDGYGMVKAEEGMSTLFARNVAGNNDNYRALRVWTSQHKDKNNSAYIMDKVNGAVIYYNIYGEHNKPSGTYTGNGSAENRSVSIGGMKTVDGAVFIRGGAYNAIIGGTGGAWWDTSGNHGAIPASEAMFENRTLWLNTQNSAVNGNGTGYMWNVLV